MIEKRALQQKGNFFISKNKTAISTAKRSEINGLMICRNEILSSNHDGLTLDRKFYTTDFYWCRCHLHVYLCPSGFERGWIWNPGSVMPCQQVFLWAHKDQRRRSRAAFNRSPAVQKDQNRKSGKLKHSDDPLGKTLMKRGTDIWPYHFISYSPVKVFTTAPTITNISI